jgi:type I restriction enzyme S subunit
MELNTLCELIVDCEHKTAPTQDAGYPSIRTPNIGKGHFILDGVNRVSEETYRLWTRRAVPQPGDLIMAREAPVGNVALVPPGLRPCLGQRTLLIRPDRSKVIPAYLNYLLNGPVIQGVIHAKTNGATVPHLNMKDVRGLVLPELPPLPIQLRIAGILSAYDELIDNSQRRIEILEAMAHALYREWFVHFRFPGHESVPLVPSPLGEIPDEWEVGRLDDLLVLQRGFDLPKAKRLEGEVPVYAATGVTGFHNKAIVKGPGVVTGRSGTIGSVIYVHEDFWPLNTALWVKEFPKAKPLYAYYVLLSLDLKQFNSGAAVPTLNRNDIHGLDALIPPRQLQQRFQDIASSMLNQARTLGLQIKNLRCTRDLLLPRLLSGQLDVEALPELSAESQGSCSN